MKVALVYDRVNKWGGAERVLLALHRIFPEAPLYTSVYNLKTAKWAKVFPKVNTSFLQYVPFAKSHHDWFAPLMPLAFESFNFDNFDVVISVTSEFAKGVVTSPKTKHICYCLTPTRYLWSGYDDYFRSKIFRLVSAPIVWWLRKYDIVAAKRPDVMIGISSAVKKRIKKYYMCESEVIFPPKDDSISRSKRLTSRVADYFLIVSRLVPYKKVDLAIKAFSGLNEKLVIVGTGSEESRLRAMANPNIKFVGQVTDGQLAQYYENCKALIFPQEEDFGLVVLEALSHGKPVIAYKKGGALDMIVDGKNGIFFTEQTVQSLSKAIKRLFTMKWSDDIIISTSSKFSKERFKKEFINQLK